MDNFYCQQKCGEVNFSIKEWNKALKYCDDMNLSENERKKILDGEPCKEQCFDCMSIVGQTRLKNSNYGVEKYKVLELVKEAYERLLPVYTNDLNILATFRRLQNEIKNIKPFSHD